MTRNDEPVVVKTQGSYTLRMYSLDGQFARNSWIRFTREGYIIFQSYFKEGEFPLAIKWPINLETWIHYSLTYQPSWYNTIASDWPSHGDYTSLPEDQSALVWYFSSSFFYINPVISYTALFNYQYGIVAYFNGKEIYRDHLPSGPIMPTTPATTFYPTEGFHGVSRNGGEVHTDGVRNNILAVEVHFQQPTHCSTFRIRWIPVSSSFPSSDSTNLCSILPLENVPALYQENEQVAHSLHDWNLGLPTAFQSFSDSTYLLYELEIVSQVMAWHVITSSSCALTDFSMEVRWSAESEWKMLPTQTVDLEQFSVGENEYIIHLNSLQFASYQAVRWIPRSSNCTPLRLQKIHPLLCKRNIPITRGSLSLQSGVIADEYTFIHIQPIVRTDSVVCNTSTLLPAGLTFSSDCVLSGIPSEPFPQGVVDVYWHDGVSTMHSTFLLEVREVAGVGDPTDSWIMIVSIGVSVGVMMMVLIGVGVVWGVRHYQKKHPSLPTKKKVDDNKIDLPVNEKEGEGEGEKKAMSTKDGVDPINQLPPFPIDQRVYSGGNDGRKNEVVSDSRPPALSTPTPTHVTFSRQPTMSMPARNTSWNENRIPAILRKQQPPSVVPLSSPSTSSFTTTMSATTAETMQQQQQQQQSVHSLESSFAVPSSPPAVSRTTIICQVGKEGGKYMSMNMDSRENLHTDNHDDYYQHQLDAYQENASTIPQINQSEFIPLSLPAELPEQEEQEKQEKCPPTQQQRQQQPFTMTVTSSSSSLSPMPTSSAIQLPVSQLSSTSTENPASSRPGSVKIPIGMPSLSHSTSSCPAPSSSLTAIKLPASRPISSSIETPIISRPASMKLPLPISSSSSSLPFTTTVDTLSINSSIAVDRSQNQNQNQTQNYDSTISLDQASTLSSNDALSIANMDIPVPSSISVASTSPRHSSLPPPPPRLSMSSSQTDHHQHQHQHHQHHQQQRTLQRPSSDRVYLGNRQASNPHFTQQQMYAHSPNPANDNNNYNNDDNRNNRNSPQRACQTISILPPPLTPISISNQPSTIPEVSQSQLLQSSDTLEIRMYDQPEDSLQGYYDCDRDQNNGEEVSFILLNSSNCN